MELNAADLFSRPQIADAKLLRDKPKVCGRDTVLNPAATRAKAPVEAAAAVVLLVAAAEASDTLLLVVVAVATAVA